jgi:Putative zinc ribbon domain
MAGDCQSCGMPLAKDPGGGGTEANGAESALYCSLCYRDGAFLQADFNAAQMQAFCVEQLSKKGMPRLMAWLFHARHAEAGAMAGGLGDFGWPR